jgi:hypothetical protein
LARRKTLVFPAGGKLEEEGELTREKRVFTRTWRIADQYFVLE